jgi:acyl-CoA hydrolase
MWSSQYQEKLKSADAAARIVKSGDVVFLGEFVQNVEAMDTALASRKDELKDVIIVTTTRAKPLKCVEADKDRSVFTWDDWHFSGMGRKYSEQGLVNYIPFTYHQGPEIIAKYNKVDVVCLQVTPMDETGFFNFSTSNSIGYAYCQKAVKVIVEVNKSIPRCLGGA